MDKKDNNLEMKNSIEESFYFINYFEDQEIPRSLFHWRMHLGILKVGSN